MLSHLHRCLILPFLRNPMRGTVGPEKCHGMGAEKGLYSVIATISVFPRKARKSKTERKILI